MASVSLHLGDALDVLQTLEPGSVDAICTDLPYGTTACAWDTVIPFAPMWEAVKHVLKPRGVFVTTASQPFTSALVMSNPGWFKYAMVWRKQRVTGHLDAKRKPLREHEDVVIFCDGQPTYNPQMKHSGGHVRGPFGRRNGKAAIYGDFLDDSSRANHATEYYPRSTFEFISPMQSIHPTQKPVALYEYLIRTYTNAGDTVLDFCMGSGTTGVAAIQTGRRFVGVEIDPTYYAIAEKRIANAQAQPPLIPHEAAPQPVQNGLLEAVNV